MGKHTKKFNAAIKTITAKRGRDYGHPASTFDNIAVLQLVVKRCPDPRIRHALEMICVKMIRLTVRPDHLDSIIDIAGYAKTMAEILDHDDDDNDPKEAV
jgi:hypothetical protein|tara:strand:+ start:2102 stop:2401 length:300 start_codon:yes stop_codon:yes gene_type:complete